ncbi:hypothetical protein SAMN02982929_03449 [Saccharopolyspora kobensis]|uniref:Uncharacterized protein n=1 Tax=Saccharopolyspora kobensis TaxID=146035 RepID=A0A1H6CRZ0_9PSEU|nr:hypothetical protein [Saccharopolyspora kobensis]SEG75423.1 hypothetical protein SAMN02982929_03449 [Saccharopolyspora kobensis]SFC96477.1 hypothetical protein SAMN05216506_10242 [Saccharopolyspora kobensis]
MEEKDLPESETVVEVTGVSVSLSVKRTEVPEPQHLPPGETHRDSPGEVPAGFVQSRFEAAVPATYGEPVQGFEYSALEPAIPGEVAEPYSVERGEELQHGVLQPALPGEPVKPVEPALPPLEPQTVTKRHALVQEPAKTEPAIPGEPGLPPTEPLQPMLKAKRQLAVVVVPKEPGETAPEFRRALKPAAPGNPSLPVGPGSAPIPGEQPPSEAEPARILRRLLTPAEQGHEVRNPEPEVRDPEPEVPGRRLLPAQPKQSAVIGVPAQPVQPAVPAGAPPAPEGTVEAPVQQPKQQLAPMQQPQQPPLGYNAPPGQNTPVQNPPTQNPPTQNTPGQNTTPGNSNYTGGGYNFPGMPSGFGNYQVPPNGDVGPDPNIQFDEAQYTALIAVIGEIKAGARKAITHNDVYLDAELLLQPMSQTWEPAQRLVKWGGTFGGTVDTENKNLRKKLSQLESGLEKAKVVFKDTDDLAAYDVTKFTTEFPGFTGGTGAV